MAELSNRTLPNGHVITDVPTTVTDDELQDFAVKAGILGANETTAARTATQRTARTASAGFPTDIPETVGYPEQSLLSEAGRMMVENPEIPGGLGGALAGTATGGAIAGPPGAIIGGIVGGAVGSGAGSLAGDAVNDEELDYEEAVKEAALSAGIDLATLGTGRLLRPGYLLMMKKLGFGPQETAQMIIDQAARGGQAGSPESIQASQSILSQRGATFTPFQTGRAGTLSNISERIANVGLFSSGIIENNLAAQSRAVSDEMTEMLTSLSSSGALPTNELGASMYEIIQLGKSALGTTYERGLNEITSSVSGRLVPKSIVLSSIKNFLARGQTELGSTYDDDTLKFINRQIERFENAPNQIKASTLIEVEKLLQRQINQFGNASSGVFNDVASRDLAIFSNEVREAMVNTLRTINDDVAERFVSLKRSYSEGIDSLMPEINSTFVRRASKDQFQPLGKMLTETGNAEQVQEFFNSIDSAYEAARVAGSDLPIATAEEAKNLVRAGFLEETLPEVFKEGFDLRTYRNLASKLERPSLRAKYTAVLGENYPQFKQLVNIMSEASQRPSSNIGELFARTKEYQSIGNISNLGRDITAYGPPFAAGAAAFGSGGSALGVTSAIAILATPVMLAKIATNPARINRLVAFEKRQFGSSDELAVASINLVADLMATMSEEEQAEIRNIARQYTSEGVLSTQGTEQQQEAPPAPAPGPVMMGEQ